MAAETPRSTRWEQVPADLYTMTQLRRLDPPRRLLPGVAARAHALYHGNKYAPLYTLDDSEVRPAATPAQVASARRAGELCYVCRFCTYVDPAPLQRRVCDDCRRVIGAYKMHLEARASLAGRHMVQPYRPLYGAATFHPDSNHADRLVLVDPEKRLNVVADVRLPGGPAWRDEHSYEQWHEYFDGWQPHHEALKEALAGRPLAIWDRESTNPVSWQYGRWLGHLQGHGPKDMPGATGDLITDARALARLVAGVVYGRLAPPDPCWVDAGLTPAQMRPYAGDVVKFVDALAGGST